MTSKTIPFDVVDYLKTSEDIASYLKAAFEDGDPRVISHARANAARAKGILRLQEHRFSRIGD